MGQTNLPSNFLDRIKRVERDVKKVWKAVGLSSATIAKGGLSLIQDAFIRAVDINGHERFYVGSTEGWESFSQSVFLVRDGAGQLRIAMYDPLPVADGYQPVFWVYDHLGNVAFTTDKNGGVAEPWISVPMYLRAFPSTFLDATETRPTLPVSACNGNAVWEGRIGKVSHPKIQWDIAAGRVSGTSGLPTYRFLVNGVELDEFTTAVQGGLVRGPFDISSLIGQQNVVVRVELSATGTGTDRVQFGLHGVWMRQT